MKALGYEALLNQDEGTLTAIYPHGAAKTSAGKWAPSETNWRTTCRKAAEHRSLKELLKDKRARQEKPRYMRRSYSIPKPRLRKDGSWVPTGTDDDNYTYDPEKALEKADVVPADVQRQFSEEARLKREVTHAYEIRRATMRTRLAILRDLGIQLSKSGEDPIPELDAAIEKLQKKKAA